MSKRILLTLISLALIATACSITEQADSVASAGGETSAEPTESASEPTTDPAGADTEESLFFPPLEGPFADGGIVSADFADADLILEDPPALPQLLASLPWETNWTRRTVDNWSEFLAGIPTQDPRDVIPPIDAPVFESPQRAAEWLQPNEPGALVQLNGEARFYPLSIMTQHEIVNDAFGDVPVAVTFCPLCNTSIAFDRRVDGEVLRFGVSGLLRNSDLVMWDDQTTSLWQQLTGDAVVGEHAGLELEWIPTSVVSFSQFSENFPDGLSLAGESGRGRASYGANPYVGYSSSAQPFLFDGVADDRLPALSRVIGISESDTVAAYSFDQATANGVINDEVDGRPVVVLAGGDTTDALDGPSIGASQPIGSAIAYDPVVDGQTLTFAPNGDGTFTDEQTSSTWTIVGVATDGPLAGTQLGSIEHRNEFWFAWQAFFGPDTLREL